MGGLLFYTQATEGIIHRMHEDFRDILYAACSRYYGGKCLHLITSDTGGSDISQSIGR